MQQELKAAVVFKTVGSLLGQKASYHALRCYFNYKRYGRSLARMACSRSTRKLTLILSICRKFVIVNFTYSRTVHSHANFYI